MTQCSRASPSWPQLGLHPGPTRWDSEHQLLWILLHLWSLVIARNLKNVRRLNTYFEHGLPPEILGNMCILIMLPGS